MLHCNHSHLYLNKDMTYRCPNIEEKAMILHKLEEKEAEVMLVWHVNKCIM